MTQLPSDPYNYERFKAKYYDLQNFNGPKPGEHFPDFSLKDASGNIVGLTDFKGKWVILESGSISCPQYINNINMMSDLEKKFTDIIFLVLYVREAHPGNKIPAHTSYEAKKNLANRVKQEYQDRRTILVDSREGECHQRLGSRPNLIYLISPERKVVFRSDWNVPEKLEEILKKRSEIDFYENDHFEPKLAAPLVALKVILSAGFIALVDLVKALPMLIKIHISSKKIVKF